MTALGGAEGQLTGALGRLFAVAEAYPDLKANQNMLALQEELSATENKIAFARQAYNDAVMVYNTQREVFPTTMIASMFNFQEANLFEVEQAAEREARRFRSRDRRWPPISLTGRITPAGRPRGCWSCSPVGGGHHPGDLSGGWPLVAAGPHHRGTYRVLAMRRADGRPPARPLRPSGIRCSSCG